MNGQGIERHVLVTGAGSGIGRAIALEFGNRGARVSLLGRNRESLDGTRAQIAGQARVLTADVTDEEAVSAAFVEAREALGPVEILINNAGRAVSAPFAKTDPALWQSMLSVNLTGPFLCVREVLPAMQKAGYGRIINVASTAGRKGYAYVVAYCASKHGLIGMTRALAQEVAGSGITVNAICPGYVDTEMTRRTIANIVEKTGRSEQQALQRLVAHSPQKRLIQPEEVARAAWWLCEETSAGVTGQSIMVDGGEVT